ncbi:TPA: hypothetical protein ACXYLK_002744 [Legionella pneumophila]|uniref:Uncharacterized protein n=1 Tax=Legionella pneumophila subsp. pneumophila TaxID=91891 RepID=A0A3A6UQF7_LEGPN|nr:MULTISPECIES: hypothetical protein [Legionella]HAT7809673.1 hypothetical protein [Legionella pneumophila]MBN5936146.1 hypothetical protein [Legionella anisa]RJY24212.1 hypothetical protein D1I00_16720 [Legionella pneumophila subsp. pneumophila]RJY24660.1 hypothetical protein D1H98_16700 [Legionella pneumophila subsp. pneumophila]RUR04054.1 hypothetical protein ELY15_15895 [Legionella sp. km772]
MSVLSIISSIIKEIKSPAFKIESDDEDPKTGLIFFWVKIENKSVHPMKKDPIELLREARSKNCFSKKDYDWIIDVMLENQKRLIENKFKKNFSLIKHQFSEQLEEPLVVYKDLTNKIYIKPAKEIYSSIEKLKKFNSEDSACIGNIVGSHEAEQEYRLRNQCKNSNVIKFDTSLLSR